MLISEAAVTTARARAGYLAPSVSNCLLGAMQFRHPESLSVSASVIALLEPS